MPAQRQVQTPGFAFPAHLDVIATRHAVERLRQRYRRLEIATDAEAREVLQLACQTGRMLRSRDVAKYVDVDRSLSIGLSCYSVDLGGLMLLSIRDGAAIVITVLRCKIKAKYRHLFDPENN